MNPKSRITALQMPKTTLERPLIALASRALKVTLQGVAVRQRIQGR